MNTPSPVAVVTGGARGIGLAIGEWFLAQGWRVALIDRDAATLAATAGRLEQPALCTVLADVSQPPQVQRAMDEVVQTFGRIDALVNNAGVAVFKPVLQTSFAEFREVMATNLDGAFLCTQAVAPVMLRTGGGAIVNLSSAAGRFV